jgi:exopolysaccharide production protein ExoQ
MPPLLALLLCAVFVLYLFRTDVPTDCRGSISLWIPTLWLMYCGSRELIYWFGNGMISDNGSTLEEGSQIDRLFLSALIALAILVLTNRRIQWRTVFDRNRWLTALYCYAFISVVWSDVPFSSFKRFVRLAGGVLMALIILTERSPRQALESVFKRLVYVLIPFSLVLIKYFPDLGVAYRPHSGGKSWIGVTMGKNQLGVLCVLSGFFLVWNFFKRQQNGRTRRGLLATAAYLLLFSIVIFMMFGEGAYSATALVCLPAGIGTFYLLRAAQRRCFRPSVKTLLIPMTGLFLIGASLPFLGTSPVAGMTGLLGRDATLTERTDIWNILRPLVADSPLLGRGFGGFWTQNMIMTAEVNEAHNGYLEVILVLGLVGLILLFGFIVSYCFRLHRSLGSDLEGNWAIFGFCLLIMIVLHEATEASFLAEADLLWTSLIFVSMSYPTLDAPEAFGAPEEEVQDAPHFAEEVWV